MLRKFLILGVFAGASASIPIVYQSNPRILENLLKSTATSKPAVEAQPDVNLVLFPPGADPGVTDDERRVITEMMAKGTYAMLTLATTDLDGLFERLQATDAEVMQEPTEQHWGGRDCAFRDPSGNTIRIDEVR